MIGIWCSSVMGTGSISKSVSAEVLPQPNILFLALLALTLHERRKQRRAIL